MTGVLLAFLLFQVNPVPTGIVTGQVQSMDGKPASGIRVYAVPAGDLNAAGINAAVYEGLTQTDASGHYTLAIPVGRYAIAAGSVESPTYFPGTPDIAAARVISVVSGTAVGNVDFSRYVPANSSLPPGSTGILSGVIRLPDGTPASGIPVALVPLSFLAQLSGNPGLVTVPPITVTIPSTAIISGASALVFRTTFIAGTITSTSSVIRVMAGGGFLVVTDSAGRYRISNVPPDNYYIVTGFNNAPTYYPGTAERAAATTITTTSATTLDTLNFNIPAPPLGTTIRGKVSAVTGAPATEATLELQPAKPPAPDPLAVFLPATPSKQVLAEADGAFRIANVPPGTYDLIARMPDLPTITRSIVVADRPVDGVDIAFRAVPVSGRITLEDGSPFPDLQSLGSVRVGRSILTVSQNGRFSRILESGEYRIYLHNLPHEYMVQSITDGFTDLIREPLNVRGDAPVNIEIRLARRTNMTVRFSGKILDAVSGAPASTGLLQLCCFESGPVERISSAIRPDGTFDFAGVPPGQYTAELIGGGKLSILDPAVKVGEQATSEVTLASVSQLVSVSGTSHVDGTGFQPQGLSLTFTGAGGVARVVSTTDSAGMFRTMLPAGERYRVSVSKVPDGYAVISVFNGSENLLDGNLLGISGPAVSSILITVTLNRPPVPPEQ